jgi:hypothetical protein
VTSDAGDFGGNGAYVVVKGANGHHAARVPIHETFHVYVDDEGVLRTAHVLRLWSATVLRLHYKLCPFQFWNSPPPNSPEAWRFARSR